jgi:predicted lipoprotein with Yx(FWY)xxD motif
MAGERVLRHAHRRSGVRKRRAVLVEHTDQLGGARCTPHPMLYEFTRWPQQSGSNVAERTGDEALFEPCYAISRIARRDQTEVIVRRITHLSATPTEMLKRISKPASLLTRRSGLLAGAAGIALLTAACGSSTSSTAGAGGASTSQGSVPASAGQALGTKSTSLGTVLVAPSGKTVYMFTSDSAGHSACSAACASFWVPVTAPASPTAPTAVTATLGALTRSDGAHQLTVAGLPVYTFVGDSGPGATSGQGLNKFVGNWYVLTSSGSIVKGSGSSASPSATHSSSGGGYGY